MVFKNSIVTKYSALVAMMATVPLVRRVCFVKEHSSSHYKVLTSSYFKDMHHKHPANATFNHKKLTSL